MFFILHYLPQHGYWFLICVTFPMVTNFAMIFRVALRKKFDMWDWLFWSAFIIDMNLGGLVRLSEPAAITAEWIMAAILAILALKVIFEAVKHSIRLLAKIKTHFKNRLKTLPVPPPGE